VIPKPEAPPRRRWSLASGAFRERLWEAWVELRLNPGRSTLQTLGVILGVASVLGGFSISDSFRRQSEALYVRMGGLDKLNVTPSSAVKDGTPSANQNANLGLRSADKQLAEELERGGVEGASLVRSARARVRSPFQDQDRRITGVGGDQLAIDGYELAKGRAFSLQDQADATPVAILGTQAAKTFFPAGDALGQTLRIGTTPVKVVGVLQEKVFRFREGGHNIFHWRNRIILVPSTLVSRRFQGDLYERVDRVTFRITKLEVMKTFQKTLVSLLKGSHRQQDDVRMDDVAARIRKRDNQGDAYNIIFMLSGVLALLGGGIVNVNIQMASLKERVREVGVKMAIGASGPEVFKGFMTEALLLTALGSLAGLALGVAFSRIITWNLGVPLFMDPKSFLWAYLMAGLFGFVFALFPAWKASRLSPMEALRYE
jgi:ABC-type antimicrobial peptide transport system permease subunit